MTKKLCKNLLLLTKKIQVIVAQISKNWVFFGNFKVLPFQNRHFWKFHGNFGKKGDFLSVRCCPAFGGQSGQKYKFDLSQLIYAVGFMRPKTQLIWPKRFSNFYSLLNLDIWLFWDFDFYICVNISPCENFQKTCIILWVLPIRIHWIHQKIPTISWSDFKFFGYIFTFFTD